MSELQLGLLAIGAVVVIAVLAFNKWQEIRFRREAEAGLGSRHDDVLMGAGEVPAAAHGVASAAEHAGIRGAREHERVEPTFDEPAGTDSAMPAAHGASEEPVLAELLDFIVPVEASEDIEGEVLVEAAAVSLSGFSKPVRLEGFDPGGAKWEPLQPGARYARMRARLQLVDRRGLVDEGDLAAFGAGVQQAAAAAGALATVPELAGAMAHANELDQFCSQVDILIAMNVIAVAAPFPGTKVRALAEANGLVIEEDGRFRRRDDQGRVLYELADKDGTPFHTETMRSLSVSGLTLELDVPRTPDPARAFEQFRDLIHQLANVLEGRVVDEKQATVSPAAFDQILLQIQAVQGAMAARSIPPGTASALRLFS